MKDLSFQERPFRTSDDVLLHGRFFPATQSKGTIAHFHGNARNISAHGWDMAWMVRHGYNVFTFDYRGYGRSESSPGPEGLRQDGLAFLRTARQLHQQHGNGGKFIVVGQSLGGAIALRAIQDLRQNSFIDLAVIDSGFASFQNVVLQKMISSTPMRIIIPFVPIVPLVPLFISDKTAPDMEQFAHPLLVIHSRNDPKVPFACGKSLYQRAASRKKAFWETDDHDHIVTFASPRGRKRLLNLIAR